MNNIIRNTFAALSLLYVSTVYAQDIQIIVHESFKYEPSSTLEIVLNFEVINISSTEQTIFEVRTENTLPPNWTSSLCFGLLCFAPHIDSVATTPDFSTNPLQPGDTLETSIHVFTDQTSIGTAYVSIEVGTFLFPGNRVNLDFVATTDPTLSVDEEGLLNTYYLLQNYPNPFNPSTRINYNIEESGLVQLKVYNILGVEVASLVNEYKYSGNYSVDFDASGLSSGVYLYELSVNNFTQTRKMILEK